MIYIRLKDINAMQKIRIHKFLKIHNRLNSKVYEDDISRKTAYNPHPPPPPNPQSVNILTIFVITLLSNPHCEHIFPCRFNLICSSLFEVVELVVYVLFSPKTCFKFYENFKIKIYRRRETSQTT